MTNSAHEHALLLAASVAVAGGPRMCVAGPRAYFPGGDFVSLGARGEVSDVDHGRQTFTDRSLPDRWKRGWKDGLRAYLDTLSLSARAQNPVSVATIKAAINVATKAAGRAKPTVVSAKEYSKAVDAAERELHVETEDAVYGCGDFGCAAQLAHRHGILKITTDHAEEMAVAAIVRTRAYEGFAQIWKGPVPLDPFPGMKWTWFAYTREVITVTDEPMPPGSWNILIDLNTAHENNDETAFLRALTKLWRFAATHPSMAGIARTVRTLWREGYMLADFHAGNYGIRDGVFVLFDARASLRAPRATKRLENPRKRAKQPRKRAKLPPGVKDWFTVFAVAGAPKPGERGATRPLPFDLKDAILAIVRLWRDSDAGPMLHELLASEGFFDEYQGELLDSEDRLFTMDDLPDLTGIDASPDDIAYLVRAVAQAQEDLPSDEADAVPIWLEVGIVADALDPEARARPRLINVSKEFAESFIAEHHQHAPEMKKKGLLYAIGVAVGDRIVAVATAGTPSGPFSARSCPPDGILELSRIASDATVKGASSMLAARLIDLTPRSGRRDIDGCLFITYSLLEEEGTTYLALTDKGLRPVGMTNATKPSGARRGAGATTALRDKPKIIWEAGPAALPPNWSLLEQTTVPAARVQGAMQGFYAWERRERRAGRGIELALPPRKA